MNDREKHLFETYSKIGTKLEDRLKECIIELFQNSDLEVYEAIAMLMKILEAQVGCAFSFIFSLLKNGDLNEMEKIADSYLIELHKVLQQAKEVAVCIKKEAVKIEEKDANEC